MWTCEQRNVAWWVLQSCKSIYVTSKGQKGLCTLLSTDFFCFLFLAPRKSFDILALYKSDYYYYYYNQSYNLWQLWICLLCFWLRLIVTRTNFKVTFLYFVNESVIRADECVVTDGSVLYSLHRFCLVHTADSCVNEGWFSCDQVIIWMCFMCLLTKRHSAFK